MDEEWQQHESKLARFIKKDGEYVDVAFSGNQCDVPLFKDVYCFYVGLYAGNLHTTTPAYVPAKKSILCKTDEPEPPTPDVYEQLKRIMADGLDFALAQANIAAQAAETAENARSESTKNAAVAYTSAVDAKASETNAAKSEQNAEVYSQLAKQCAEDAGWFMVEGGDDGYLYMIRSDNAPEDFNLVDDGEGRLVAVYG